MVITGVLLFYAIPVGTYQSIFFRVKVAMLLLAGLNVWLFHSRVERRVADWDLDAGAASRRPRRRRGLAGPLGGHHRRRPHDRLQLVRLRHPAAARLRQLGRRLPRLPQVADDCGRIAALAVRMVRSHRDRPGHPQLALAVSGHRGRAPARPVRCWAARCWSSICGCWASGFAPADRRDRAGCRGRGCSAAWS